ncbi:HAMP domain-containing histidine kinase [Persephonella atlantica]|uniref:histidine kinase n=1 Tax=Persephonella atlantica TaxID=2699429 RepID=A0ABS1GGV8_9AQUI|nr:HAMP domain-containing sensor histidine kinase [Persephonella atlantica]MBK3332164.1 HAMP domain-containing histidine kinase [Persephonella atlantica]
MIKKLFSYTRYEKESFIKSFLLFFLSMETLFAIITVLYFLNQTSDLKNEIFLKLKNYSYVLKGNDYKVELSPHSKNINFYQLYEDGDRLYIYIPIPFMEEDVLKIIYPEKRYKRQKEELLKEIFTVFSIVTVFILILSFAFSVYSINPLRKSLKMINEFIQDITHDINTPISSMLINLKMLKMKYPEDEEVKMLESAISKLNSINENLSFLNQEVRKNIADVNIKEIVEEEIKQMKNIFPDIKVKTYLNDVNIKTDKTALRRIVSNILSNAFKHNIKNGWVNVYLTKDYIKVVNSSRTIKNPSKLFERYYRESQRGLGLGLSIVQKLSEELGFRIKIEATGNKFSIIIYF